MKLRHLFLWDMRFQNRHGFYLLYAILTVIYSIILFVVPDGWKEKTAAILIFTDPASMGLFFMGAIILLEKNQHIPCAFSVSPVRPAEYILAKVGSLSAISIAVAAVLAFAAKAENAPVVLLGTLFSCVIFTLLSIIVAERVFSLNQFILWTVPVEVVCFVPAVLHLFKITPTWLRYYPFNACMDMVSGDMPSAIGFAAVVALIAILFPLAGCCVRRIWRGMGGVKL